MNGLVTVVPHVIFGFTGIFDTGWTPPDPEMAVGPDHVVLMTNGKIAFFTKTGTQTFEDEIAAAAWAPRRSSSTPRSCTTR